MIIMADMAVLLATLMDEDKRRKKSGVRCIRGEGTHSLTDACLSALYASASDGRTDGRIASEGGSSSLAATVNLADAGFSAVSSPRTYRRPATMALPAGRPPAAAAAANWLI